MQLRSFFLPHSPGAWNRYSRKFALQVFSEAVPRRMHRTTLAGIMIALTQG